MDYIMPKMVDLTSKTFGRLTVIENISERNYGNVMWKCKCECGKIIVIRGTSLTGGNAKSCGCLRGNRGNKGNKGNKSGRNIKDMTGQTFGRLTVLSLADKRQTKKRK